MNSQATAASRRLYQGLAALVVAWSLALLAPTLKAHADDFAASIRQATATSKSLGAATAWNNAAETKLVDQLDTLADHFHEAVSQGSSLPREAAALLDVVEVTRKRYTDHIEALQAEVIRIDGDLEAVQDSADWRDRELLAMRLLYRENWIRYEYAVRYEKDSARRKKQLRQARDGFSEFAGAGDPALTAESMFGRGLCSKALTEYDSAASDLKAVLDSEAGREMAPGARIALAETELARGRTSDALGSTAKLINSASSGESRRQAAFLRAKALLLATGAKSNASATQAAAWRKEATKLLEELYNSGSYWRSKALQLIDAGIQNPTAWAGDGSSPFVTYLVAESIRRRGDCGDAIALYETLLAAKRYEDESAYGIGFCSFHQGDPARALAQLSVYMDKAAADSPYRSQASYLRFKSSEALALSNDAEPDDELVYRQALVAFIEEFPEHDQAFEAWFRLGELRREDGDLGGCSEAFAKVSGDPAFELKAAFLGAQCAAGQVLNLGEDAQADAAEVDHALGLLDAFIGRFADQDADKLALAEPMIAKATVLGAALAAKRPEGGMQDRLARLENFETRFPNSSDAMPEVHSLRIVAYRSTGDLTAAGSELRALLALPETGKYQGDTLKKLGIVFLNEGSREQEQGNAAAALEARRTALTIYERLLADQAAGLLQEPVEPLQALVDKLRQQTQTGEATQ